MKDLGINLQEVERLYLEEGMSLSRLSARFGVSASEIRHRLRKMGTPLRPSFRKVPDDFGLTKDFLEREYITNRKNCKQIADELGCAESNVWYKIKQFQIPMRTHSQANLGIEFSVSHREALSKSHLASSKKRSGPDNPNWRGGVSTANFLARYKGTYIVWRRRAIRIKGNICSVCGKDLKERCPHCGRASDTHVHHIQEFAENPDLRFSLDNVVILCEPCHKEYHKK